MMMGNELLIRLADQEDIGIIRSLAEEVWPGTYEAILTREQIRYMMELFYSLESLQHQMTRHKFLLAVLKNEPVGFASYSSTPDPQVYKLHKIYINPGVQGKGVGKALITFITNKIQAAGATALDLNVNRNNQARLFYEKLGFTIIKEEDIDIGNNFWMNDYVMRLNIDLRM